MLMAPSDSGGPSDSGDPSDSEDPSSDSGDHPVSPYHSRAEAEEARAAVDDPEDEE